MLLFLWLSNLVISSKRTFETIKYMKKEDMKIHDKFVINFFLNDLHATFFVFLYIRLPLCSVRGFRFDC